ncbi:non-ribosomal peptide synthetase [Stappia taiwanensis]|uniref:Non-ribosomal peptide synthetase n=1 Tax=Stappia taiwanensis TaxID=992267 RepID=A0A838XRQ6_9HYPH|nr:non-ribosomal peptide synthetase [Stappia taiwanensis]MBA4611741.1 non-ribosomal peptide synthetase [Stappia taiwanensis]GGE97153.1 hypothetical protein GCM10007285_25970 [Stappia taiwanensis]
MNRKDPLTAQHDPFCVPRSNHMVAYDRNRSLQDVFHQHARAQPDRVALTFGDRPYGYHEADRLSSALAHRLLELGVRKGDVVGLFLPRSAETVIAMLAILKAGAAYTPIDPVYPAEHLDYVIGDCAPKVIFTTATDHAKLAAIASVRGKIVELGNALRQIEDRDIEPPSVPVGGGDMAYVMYTSGSTGRPKGVMIPHRAIADLALEQSYVNVGPGDVVLNAATISFDGATMEIWCALLNGSTLAGLPDPTFSVSRLCDVIRRENVNFVVLTTGLFNLFADSVDGSMPSLTHVLFGGEVASATHIRKFHRIYPHCRVTNGYGPTEATTMVTCFSPPPDFAGTDVPIGKAIARTGIHIIGEGNRELSDGEVGELAISGDCLALGYFKRPDLTDEKFRTVETRQGPRRCYLTGDLARVEPDGTITFKGRADRQVKIDGKRIELDEIEAALRRDPEIDDAIVSCQATPTSKRIVAYLKPRDAGTSHPAFASAALTRLRAAVPAFMVPSAAVAVDAFPMTQAGKVDRARLAPISLQDDAPASPRASSRSPIEATIARLWSDVLGRDAIPLDRNFFDLGGTSLQLMRVHVGLEGALQRSVDVMALFTHPTIRGLANFLEGRGPVARSAMTATHRAAIRRQSLSQISRNRS